MDKTVVSVATADEILANDIISFNGKDYIKDEIVAGEGYELKRLGDICDFSKGCGVSKENRTGGKFPYYASNGHISGSYMKERNVKGEFILLAEDGTIGAKHFIKDTNEIYVGDHVHILRGINISNILIFGLLELVDFPRYTTGSVIPKLNKRNLNQIMLSIPKSPEKIQYWVDKISTPFNEKNKKQNLLENLEKEVLERVKYISENEECDNIKLEDMCNIMYGKRITKDKDIGSIYVAYGGGDIMNYKTDTYNREGVVYKIARDGLSLHNCVKKIYGKIYLNDTAFTVKNKNDNNNILDNYIGEFLLNKKQFIYKFCSQGTAQLHINIEKFKKIKLPIPKNKNLITELEPKFAEIEQLKLDIQNAETRFDQYIKELGEEAIKK